MIHTEGEPVIDAMDLDDDDEDDVGAEESFRDKNKLLPLMAYKRFKAYSDKVGFTQLSGEVYPLMDAKMKDHLREIVLRSRLIAASRGRKLPNREDAIAAVEEMGVFPPVVIGN